MINNDLDGTTKLKFSIGTGNKRIDLRSNTGVIEMRHFNGDWFPIYDTYADTKEPTGFIGDTSSISLTFATGDFTISGDRAFYSSGTRYAKTSDESITITETNTVVYIYYDATGTLAKTTTFSYSLINTFALVSILLMDDTTAISIANEMHSCTMDSATHGYLHNVHGLQYASGLAIGDIVADADASLDIHAQLSVSSGIVYDEDIKANITSTVTPTGQFEQDLVAPAKIPVFYRTGASGDWRKATTTSFPVVSYSGGSGLLAWNEYTGGAWQQTEVNTNDYVLCHIFATTDVSTPIIAIQGQSDYSTLTDAREGATVEVAQLTYGDFVLAEMQPLATVIYHTKTTHSNTVKARICTTDEGADYIDFSKSVPRNFAATITSHSNLSNLSYYTSGHTDFQRQLTIDTSDPTANDDGADTSGNGVFQTTDYWFNTTNSKCFICTDATTGAAVWTHINAKGRIISHAEATGATNAVAGVGYLCDTTGGAFTVTLPASPSLGDVISIIDGATNFATANLTVGRNGNNIMGSASDLILSTDDTAIDLIYYDTTNGWRVK